MNETSKNIFDEIHDEHLKISELLQQLGGAGLQLPFGMGTVTDRGDANNSNVAGRQGQQGQSTQQRSSMAAQGQDRQKLFEQLKALLEHHTRAEEGLFYPILQGQPVTQMEEDVPLIRVCKWDHEDVSHELKKLGNHTSDEKFSRILKRLEREIQEHVIIEEKDAFDKGRILLTEEEANQLGKQFAEARRLSEYGRMSGQPQEQMRPSA